MNNQSPPVLVPFLSHDAAVGDRDAALAFDQHLDLAEAPREALLRLGGEMLAGKHQQCVLVEGALDGRRSYLLVSNHQSWADILILFNSFHGRVPFLRFFLAVLLNRRHQFKQRAIGIQSFTQNNPNGSSCAMREANRLISLKRNGADILPM